MADFRKWILALSALALVFTGVANAQVSGVAAPMTCVAGTAVPPQLRTEGYTELVGDITLDCTGGTAPLDGAAIPQANIVVNLQGIITSRLIASTAASEALLVIDEPGSGLTGVGPAESQFLCTTPAIGCQAVVGTVTNAGGAATAPVLPTTTTTPAQNVFEGVTNGSQVTFFGVPILAPVTSGTTRVYRITNLRVNANGITGGGSGFQSVLAQISVNNVQVSVTNPTVTVGYIQQSFAGSFRDAGNDGAVTTVNEYQCSPPEAPGIQVATLRFSELFGTAFKTRVNSTTTPPYPGTVSSAAIQNIPGAIYNSESGFISAFSGNATAPALAGVAGLADYGTRLKAVFSNLPAGVSVYVSTVNLIGTAGTGGAASTTGDAYATTASPEFAELVNTETGVDPQTPVAATTGDWFLLVPNSAGTAQVVWEVFQTLPNTIENYDFGVYIYFPINITPSSQGISAVLSYAPTPTAAFSAAAAGVASAGPIPRFAVSAAASGTPFLNINLCTTALLFPYVTTAFLVPGQSGFDTGLSVANTSMDPFGTTNQAGTCTMYWYGGTPGATTAATPPAPTVLGAGGVGSSVPIIPGTTALTLASQSVPADWSGYMIALCNFQYAHGYASVTDVGVRNIMASYLALVINDRTSTTSIGLYGFSEALNN
ncbi:MAG: hypothetical protein ACLQPN_02305 [Bryobacteraceae bacterium]